MRGSAESSVHHTFADFLHVEHSFFTSSTVGSRCILYLARGCQRSYWACRFLPECAHGGAFPISRSVLDLHVLA